MGNFLEKVKSIFDNYEDEDYRSDYIEDDEESLEDYEDYYEEDEYEQEYDDNDFSSNVDFRNNNYRFNNLDSSINLDDSKKKEGEVDMGNSDFEAKLVNFKDSSQKIVLIKPNSLEEGQEVAAQLRAGRICIVNFEESDRELAQRIIDFLTGAAYSLGGKVSAISSMIFVISPLNVVVQEGIENKSLNYGSRKYTDINRLVNGL